jgi:triosephosphate isomerase
MKLNKVWFKWLAVNIARFLIASIFLISGWSKAIDPMGMVYKLKSYTDYLGWPLTDENVFFKISVGILAVVECYIGLNLFLGSRRKSTAILAFLFMILMTIVTTFIYIYNPVQDCGCFGSFLKLTHAETLFKNIALLLLSAFVVCYPRRMRRLITEKSQWITSIYSTCFIFGLVLYSFYYSPLYSFTDYKTGVDLVSAYHGEGGELKEGIINFSASDSLGQDMTPCVINDTSISFLLILPNIATADDSSADEINDLYDYAIDHHYQFIALSASSFTEYSSWQDRTGAMYPIYMTDESVLKTMGRSNPSLLLVMQGRIRGMWGKNELPSYLVHAPLEQQSVSTETQSFASFITDFFIFYFIPLLLIIFIDGLWVGNKIYRHRKYMRGLFGDSK